MVTFNFKSPKTIGGEKTGKVGRPKGCKLVNKVHRDGKSQKRFGYRSATTSQNKNKQTPLSHGYHLEDYDRQCMYLHYYGDEDKPFYVGQGTLQRAFVFSGNRRNSRYNEKAINVDLIKVEIVEIDITPDRGVQLEKELVAKYKLIEDGGTLTNIIRGGRGGSLGSCSNNPNAKPVIQLNIYGEFIKEWGSVIEAAKALQIDSSAIAKCCRHVPKYKRAGGYVWEYKENYGD